MTEANGNNHPPFAELRRRELLELFDSHPTAFVGRIEEFFEAITVDFDRARTAVRDATGEDEHATMYYLDRTEERVLHFAYYLATQFSFADTDDEAYQDD